MLPQHVGSERMEGAELRTVAVLPQKAIDSLAHLRGRLARESEGEHRGVLVLLQ